MNEDTGLVAEEGETTKNYNLFMVRCEDEKLEPSVWLIDSGCSNHMSGHRCLFKSLDESQMLTLGREIIKK